MKYEKDGKIVTLPCLIIEGDTTYSVTTEDWLLSHGWTVYVEPVPEPTLAQVKANKIAEIDAYDQSEAVNEFVLYGTPMWLDKATRVGLVNAVNAEKALGNTMVTLGLGGHSYTLPCDQAIAMLYALESYALACYNNTLLHKNNVATLTTKEAVNAYDYTVGYPEHLNFE